MLLAPLRFLLFILGLGLLLALAGPGFQLLDGPLHLAGELFTARDFLGKLLAVLVLRISRFGLRQQLLDIQSELRADFHRPLVVHVLIDGGVGFQVGAVQRDIAELQQFQFAGELQHIHKALPEGFEVLAPELADRVVVGMGPRAQVTDRHVTVSGSLDLARGEQAVGVTVDQQRQHHVGRELLVAGAPMVDAKTLQREPLHGLNHEMDQVIFGHPIPQVRWQ